MRGVHIGQTFDGTRELSVFDDGSTDTSPDKIDSWAERFRAAGWSWEASRGHPNRGEGFARNCAVRQSHGQYICVMDADDMMQPCRIVRQLEVAKRHPDAIVGGGFRREPEDATWHYTTWANKLSQEQLLLQQYREVTMLHPTWFHSRAVFDAVGGYVELADHVDEIRSYAGAAETRQQQPQQHQGGRLAKKLAKAQAALDGFESHCGSALSATWDPGTKQAKQQQLEKLRQKHEVLKVAAAEQLRSGARRVENSSYGSGSDADLLPPKNTAAVAVDLRFFHAHLDRWAGGHSRRSQSDSSADAAAQLNVDTKRTRIPLYKLGGDPVLIYRHRPGQSMCTHTSRRTLLRLRLRAFERRVLSLPSWSQFTIW
eukprot:COSAG02_NODE_653_length_18827_cov_44.237826_5_plen_371_part_00